MADYGLGDPGACERAASECDRAARQLDEPIRRLTSLRANASSSWRGIAGDSLVQAIDARRRGLTDARSQLQTAASQLRTAASQIRAEIRLREEAERRNRARRPPSPLDLRV